MILRVTRKSSRCFKALAVRIFFKRFRLLILSVLKQRSDHLMITLRSFIFFSSLGKHAQREWFIKSVENSENLQMQVVYVFRLNFDLGLNKYYFTSVLLSWSYVIFLHAIRKICCTDSN